MESLNLVEPKRIVTHIGVHPDELVAVYLMRRELPKHFPGVDVNNVPIQFVPTTNEPFEGKDGWTHLKEGTYVLGFGGPGPFNHHPHSDFPDVCTADQMAQYLGLADKPEFEKILKRTRVNDLNTGGEFIIIAEYLRLKDVRTVEHFEEAYAWVTTYLDMYVANQVAFHSEQNGAKLERTARTWGILRDGAEIPAVTINGSSDPDVVRAARHEYGSEAVILRRPSGNVGVFTYPIPKKEGEKKKWCKRANPQVVVALLRLLEQRAHGEVVDEDIKSLMREGELFGWCYLKDGTILNGSKTATQVSPTRIPLERIEEAVAYGIKLHPYFPWNEWLTRTRNFSLNRPMFGMFRDQS